jgi:precorrin-3B methylase
LEHREPETPVGVVRNAFRPGQTVVHTTLAAMNSDDVDMLTTVIVGNRQTRFDHSWMVTPRGYSLAVLGETKE